MFSRVLERLRALPRDKWLPTIWKSAKSGIAASGAIFLAQAERLREATSGTNWLELVDPTALHLWLTTHEDLFVSVARALALGVALMIYKAFMNITAKKPLQKRKQNKQKVVSEDLEELYS